VPRMLPRRRSIDLEHTEDTVYDEDAFDPFFQEGLITEVIRVIKAGKEASVWLCRAGSSTGHRLLAAKTYLPRQHRNFKNDAVYKEGRVITKRRIRVAVEKKTSFGRQFEDGWWVMREYDALTLLATKGADVPRTVAWNEQAILMEYAGDEEGPAPQLQHVRLDREEARPLFDRLVWNVGLFLQNHLVHADLSPFNVLFREEGVLVIDFPQSVDARTNPNAPALLLRDVANLCRYFRRYGVEEDPEAVAGDLWTRYLFADL
jgi:RIO kinase 1